MREVARRLVRRNQGSLRPRPHNWLGHIRTENRRKGFGTVRCQLGHSAAAWTAAKPKAIIARIERVEPGGLL